MLDEKIKELIAVGAAVAANCQSCLEVRGSKAREVGATNGEIAKAIEVARQVRVGAAGKLDRFASGLIGAETPEKAENSCC